MNDDIRPDLPDDALRSSLRHAADDVAFAVPDLLPQARAARRGRRMRATVAGSGLVVAALLIIPPMFGPSRAVPAAPTLTPAPTSSGSPSPSPTGTPSAPIAWTGPGMPLPATGDPGAVVSHDEIVTRCQSQLARSVALYGPAPADLRVARDRDYREGDVVRLVSDGGWDAAALCLIPVDGVELDPLDLRLARDPLPSGPGKDPYLMQACSELYTHEDEETGVRSYDTVDLRDGRIFSLSGTENAPLAQFYALISLGGKHYACGWSYDADGALRLFTGDDPRVPPKPEPSSLITTIEDAYWDGVSPRAELVLSGYFTPDIAGVGIEGGGAALWYSTERGVFTAFVSVVPRGTTDNWSSSEVVVYAVDKDGNRLRSSTVAVADDPESASDDDTARYLAEDVANQADQLKKEADAAAARFADARRADALGLEETDGLSELDIETLLSTDASLPVPADAKLGDGSGEPGWPDSHRGQDFVAAEGTAVYAVASGIVLSPTVGSWAGLNAVVQHADGSTTLYAHLRMRNVSPGEIVGAGQQIGEVGDTGRAFGPHLHLEHYDPGVTPGDVFKASDPVPFLRSLGLEIG
jgi:murein DD-endopeptidase MepM/ murein hydrolase activator NlpD